METIGGEGWQLEVPPSWTASDDGEFVTIVKGEDGGAITVSAIIDEEEDISADELEIYARSKLPKGVKIGNLKVDEFNGFTAEFEDEEGVCWLHCWLAHQDLLIYFSYNGAPEFWKIEKKEVKGILQSLAVSAEEE